MSNNLERFIHKNRRDFDTEEPGDHVWKSIEKSIPVSKKEEKRFSIKDIYKWSAAAAVFFIILTSIYFLVIRKYSHDKQIVKTGSAEQVQPSNDVSKLDPKYTDEFNKAYQAIQTRQTELQSATADQPQLYQQFLKDISVLDSSYRLLRDQAGKTPNRDVIMKAMIQNLQLQAELLGRQLMISTQLNNNNSKKTSNEKTL